MDRSEDSMIRLEGVGKTFADGTVAVEALDLDVPRGELVVLVGAAKLVALTVQRVPAVKTAFNVAQWGCAAAGGSLVLSARTPGPFAPADVPVANPAFDVTPAELITALITERGVITKPTRAKVEKMMAGEAGEPAV